MIYGPEVGWFAAAHRLVISLHAFVWLYFFNLLPSISRGSRGTFESLQRLLAGSLQVSGWVGVFVVVAGTVFAAPILNIVYGAQYQPAVVSFQVMLWLIPLALVSGHFRYTLIAYNKQALEFVCAACGGLLNVVINLTVIASYGILGAAIALVVAEGLICVISYLMVRRTITVIPVGASLWKPVLGALVLAGMLYMLPPLNTWIVGASAMALFIAMVALSHRTIFADLRALLGRTG
jgi:O-antigen/teichoic acid export membrane protein